MPDAGDLYVVATPIGNLSDISERAVEALKLVDIIVCEDTRRANKLIGSMNLPKRRLLVMNKFNEARASSQAMDLLLSGEDVGLISDAGTPLISDPGYELIRAASRHGVHCIPIPGPSALTAVLSISPIPLTDFRFVGFLPSRESERRKKLNEYAMCSSTLVFFESTRRLVCTLNILHELGCGKREVFIARELTKVHESTYFGSVSDIAVELVRAQAFKGEVVCVLQPSNVERDAYLVDKMIGSLLKELSVSKVASLMSEMDLCSRNTAYRRAVELKSVSD